MSIFIQIWSLIYRSLYIYKHVSFVVLFSYIYVYICTMYNLFTFSNIYMSDVYVSFHVYIFLMYTSHIYEYVLFVVLVIYIHTSFIIFSRIYISDL